MVSLAGWIKEGELRIRVAGRGREQSRGVSFKARGSCPQEGMVLGGRHMQIEGERGSAWH